MMTLQLTVVALFALFGAGSATQLQGLNQDEYIMVVANEFSDRTIALLNKKFVALELDPYLMPYYETNITFDWLFEEHVMNVKLKNGIITGMSNLVRAGDCVMNYDLRLLRIDLDVSLALLDAYFDFDIKVLGFEPDGYIKAYMTKEEVKISLLLDMDETTISLQNFQMINTGDVDLDVGGLGLLGDALGNLMVELLTALFKNTILNKIQDEVIVILDDFFNSMGAILPKIPPEENPGSKALKFHF